MAKNIPAANYLSAVIGSNEALLVSNSLSTWHAPSASLRCWPIGSRLPASMFMLVLNF
ncbi:hypothetical protein LT85_2116 [Collimonas arenae]|uniref:Uncharacterized protein n=1 Tax=Collimonas arenae TaxID=279058 RepID=A0A0A1FCA9_9BURK|nr:hypothetical protein LT85_2116 [Collimonas arenae]